MKVGARSIVGRGLLLGSALTAGLLLGACSASPHADRVGRFADRFSEMLAAEERARSVRRSVLRDQFVRLARPPAPMEMRVEWCGPQGERFTCVRLVGPGQQRGPQYPAASGRDFLAEANRVARVAGAQGPRRRDACGPRTTARPEIASQEARDPNRTNELRLNGVAALLQYMDQLRALTRAQDRIAFDEASNNLATATGSLATTAAGFGAGPAPAAVGQLASSSVALFAWFVGTSLEADRLRMLRRATAAACDDVQTIIDEAIRPILENSFRQSLETVNNVLSFTVPFTNTYLRRSSNMDRDTSRQMVEEIFLLVDRANELELLQGSLSSSLDAMVNAHGAIVMALNDSDMSEQDIIAALNIFALRVEAFARALRATRAIN
jgi:hypothetical protein